MTSYIDPRKSGNEIKEKKRRYDVHRYQVYCFLQFTHYSFMFGELFAGL